LEVHHKIAVADGGNSAIDNLETLCRRCHMSEHRTPSEIAGRDEFRDALRRKKFPGVTA
ncbi:MAG: HNH endonuclease, partial [Gammaproteobacteria bacterium]|nr:HNH endonuclease [Gammaproteobacteria bacterium]